MRRHASILLLSTALSGGLLVVGPPVASAAPPVATFSTAPASIGGCADWDYECGYIKGFARGKMASELGLCNDHDYHRGRRTASERGFADGFETYCPPPGLGKTALQGRCRLTARAAAHVSGRQRPHVHARPPLVDHRVGDPRAATRRPATAPMCPAPGDALAVVQHLDGAGRVARRRGRAVTTAGAR
jgi:hypothetical protein